MTLAEVIRIDVELVDPIAVEHEPRGDAPALVDDPRNLTRDEW